VQLARLPELVGVRAPVVLAGNLEDGGQPLELGVREERAEALAHEAAEDVVVAVAVRAERRLGVVHV
jgi:hypothetical protein